MKRLLVGAFFILGCSGAPSVPASAPKAQADAVAVKPAAPQYPNGLTAVEVFNLRTKCADMVEKQQAPNGILGLVGNALTSDVTPHYNPNTNRCYAEVVVTKNFSYDYKEHPVPDNYRTTSVVDAQTKAQVVFADQEGPTTYAYDFKDTKDGLMVSYDRALSRVNELMEDDAQ